MIYHISLRPGVDFFRAPQTPGNYKNQEFSNPAVVYFLTPEALLLHRMALKVIVNRFNYMVTTNLRNIQV